MRFAANVGGANANHSRGDNKDGVGRQLTDDR